MKDKSETLEDKLPWWMKSDPPKSSLISWPLYFIEIQTNRVPFRTLRNLWYASCPYRVRRRLERKVNRLIAKYDLHPGDITVDPVICNYTGALPHP